MVVHQYAADKEAAKGSLEMVIEDNAKNALLRAVILFIRIYRPGMTGSITFHVHRGTVGRLEMNEHVDAKDIKQL